MGTRPFKLFIWHDVRADYTSGIAVAAARDVEEARRVLLEDLRKNFDFSVPGLEQDLKADPEVRELPAGTSCAGGG